MICDEIIYIHPCPTHKFASPSWTLHGQLLSPFGEFVLSHHYVRAGCGRVVVLWRLIPLVGIIVIDNSLSWLKLIAHSLLLRLQTINLILFFNH